MRSLVMVAVFVLAGLFFNPQLLLIAGMAFGLIELARWLQRAGSKQEGDPAPIGRSRTNRWKRRALLVGGFIGLASLATVTSGPYFSVGPPINLLTAPYSAVARFDRKTGSWQTTHRYAFDPKVMEALRRELNVKDDPALTATRAVIALNMERLGWVSAGERDDALIFERIDGAPTTATWWPLKTVNRLALPTLPLASSVVITRSDDSVLKLQAPKRLVVDTFPKDSGRSDLLMNKYEQLSVPLDPDLDELRVAVASPLARSTVTSDVLSWSDGSLVKFLLAPLSGFFVALYKKRVFAGLKRLLRIKSSPEDGGEAES